MESYAIPGQHATAIPPDAPPRPVFEGRAGSKGRLVQTNAHQGDAGPAPAMPLWWLASSFVPFAVFLPLIIWLIRKEKSPLLDDHGREVLNSQLTVLIMSLAVITVVGIPLSVAYFIVTFVNSIRGAI